MFLYNFVATQLLINIRNIHLTVGTEIFYGPCVNFDTFVIDIANSLIFGFGFNCINKFTPNLYFTKQNYNRHH